MSLDGGFVIEKLLLALLEEELFLLSEEIDILLLIEHVFEKGIGAVKLREDLDDFI